MKPRLDYAKVAPGVYDAMDALEWTEAITLIAHDPAPDAVHARVAKEFSEVERCNLTLAIVPINAWNRLSIAARLLPNVPSAAVREPAGAKR